MRPRNKTVRAMVGKLAIAAMVGIAMASSAWAFPKSTTPDAVQGDCNEKGGTYFAPNENGVYACLYPDGSVIICGGSLPGCFTSSASIGGFSGLPTGRLPWQVGALMLEVQTQFKLNNLATQIQNLSTQVQNLQDSVNSQCGGGTLQ